jgi:acetyl esterase/lipase
MRRFLIALALLLVVAIVLVAWRGISFAELERITPKDRSSHRIAEGVAFGPLARQKLDIYAPVEPAGRRLPVIVFFYGGGWASGDRGPYEFAGRALAARGFVTVIPDYRLVPEARFPLFLEDCAAAVKWVRARIAAYGGDPGRIILVGHSAGAYNAAMLALDPRWLGADRAAIRGFAGLAGPYDFLPLTQKFAVDALGAWKPAEETQPIHYVTPDDPPALLVTGDEDVTVRPRNSMALAARMRAAGIAVETRTYPGIGHVGLATAMAWPLRWRAPVVADIAAYATRMTSAAGRRPAVP